MTKLPRDLRYRVDSRQLYIDTKFKKRLKKQLFKVGQGDTMAKKLITNSSFGTFAQAAFKQLSTAAGLAALAVLIVVGGMSALVGANRQRMNSEKKVALPADLANILGVADIREAALKDVPNGTVTGIELEKEEGILIYKVRFSDGTIRYYDATTGLAVLKPVDDEDGQDESVPAGFVAGVNMQQARDIAQAQRPGKTITKIELETEHNVVVYSVRFSDGGRVDIDATSGNVIRTRSADEVRTEAEDDSNDDSSESSNSDASDDKNVESDDNTSGSDGSGSDDSSSGSGSGSNHGSSED